MRKPRPSAVPELDQLELTIRRLLEAGDGWKRRAHAAETRVRELEGAVHGLSAGHIDPVALRDEVGRLEARNRELEERLNQAYAAVQRITARLQFAAEDR